MSHRILSQILSRSRGLISSASNTRLGVMLGRRSQLLIAHSMVKTLKNRFPSSLKPFQRSCDLLSQLTTSVEINCRDNVHSEMLSPGKICLYAFSFLPFLFFLFFFYTRFLHFSRRNVRNESSLTRQIFGLSIYSRAWLRTKRGQEEKKGDIIISLRLCHFCM